MMLPHCAWNLFKIDQGGRNLGNYRQYDDPYWDKYKLVITDAITELALLMDGSNVTEEASKMAELDKAIALVSNSMLIKKKYF